MPLGRGRWRQAGIGKDDWRLSGMGAGGTPTSSEVVDPVIVASTGRPRPEYAVTGIRWPFKIINGKVALSFDENHILESIRQIIGTNKYEYLMKPDFGANLGARIFDPINVAALADRDIRVAIERWETRAEVIRTQANLDNGDLGLVNIKIEVMIKGINKSVNIGLPMGR